MPTKELTTLDKIQKHLMDENASDILTAKELEIKNRYSAAFVYWLEHPDYNDLAIINYLEKEHNISRTQAYRDLPGIKYVLGNVKLATKEWYRYTVIEMAKETYKMAKEKKKHIVIGDKIGKYDDPDIASMVGVINAIGKYTKQDKDEMMEMPWEEIIPPNFEPTNDVTVLELRSDPDIEERRKRLRAKYKGDTFIETAEVIE